LSQTPAARPDPPGTPRASDQDRQEHGYPDGSPHGSELCPDGRPLLPEQQEEEDAKGDRLQRDQSDETRDPRMPSASSHHAPFTVPRSLRAKAGAGRPPPLHRLPPVLCRSTQRPGGVLAHRRGARADEHGRYRMPPPLSHHRPTSFAPVTGGMGRLRRPQWPVPTLQAHQRPPTNAAAAATHHSVPNADEVEPAPQSAR
jgi:hypothetical protein